MSVVSQIQQAQTYQGTAASTLPEIKISGVGQGPVYNGAPLPASQASSAINVSIGEQSGINQQNNQMNTSHNAGVPRREQNRPGGEVVYPLTENRYSLVDQSQAPFSPHLSTIGGRGTLGGSQLGGPNISSRNSVNNPQLPASVPITHTKLQQWLKFLFNVYDRNKSGYIKTGELKDAFQSLGIKAKNDSVIEGLVNKFDTEGKNGLNYDEFSNIFVSLINGKGVSIQEFLRG